MNATLVRCEACAKPAVYGWGKYRCINARCPLHDAAFAREVRASFGSSPPPPPPPAQDDMGRALDELRAELARTNGRLQIVEQRILEITAERRR